MSFSLQEEPAEKSFFKFPFYIDHDHLSIVGKRTQISGTQNTGAKIFFCLEVFSSNTSKGTNAAATVEPCS